MSIGEIDSEVEPTSEPLTNTVLCDTCLKEFTVLRSNLTPSAGGAYPRSQIVCPNPECKEKYGTRDRLAIVG